MGRNTVPKTVMAHRDDGTSYITTVYVKPNDVPATHFSSSNIVPVSAARDRATSDREETSAPVTRIHSGPRSNSEAFPVQQDMEDRIFYEERGMKFDADKAEELREIMRSRLINDPVPIGVQGEVTGDRAFISSIRDSSTPKNLARELAANGSPAIRAAFRNREDVPEGAYNQMAHVEIANAGAYFGTFGLQNRAQKVSSAESRAAMTEIASSPRSRPDTLESIINMNPRYVGRQAILVAEQRLRPTGRSTAIQH